VGRSVIPFAMRAVGSSGDVGQSDLTISPCLGKSALRKKSVRSSLGPAVIVWATISELWTFSVMTRSSSSSIKTIISVSTFINPDTRCGPIVPSLARPRRRFSALIPARAFLTAVARGACERLTSPEKVPNRSVSIAATCTVRPAISANAGAITDSLPCCVASAAMRPKYWLAGMRGHLTRH